MTEPLSQDEILGISTAVEATVNTMSLIQSGYTYFYCRNVTLPVPNREKFDNTGFIGLQQEGPTIQRSGFVEPPAIQIGGDVDTNIFSVFARRILGKADPTPAGGDIIVAAESFRHKFELLGNHTAAGRQLPSSTFVTSNGAVDYLFGGQVGSQLTIAQNNADTPTYQADFLGTGQFREISTISGPSFGTPTLPTDNTASIMDGAETEAEYTDSGTKVLADLDGAADQRLKSFSLNIVSNNLDSADRRAGAKRLDSTTPNKGWILSKLLHGARSSSGTFRVGVGDSGATALDELVAALNDNIVTSLTFRMHGDPFASFGTTPTSRHTVEVIFPKCFFRNVRRAPDNGAEFIDVDIFPASSGSTTDPDFVKVNVVNAVATSIV